MSYSSVTGQYFAPIDPYYPDWGSAPFPGWGERPEVAGPRFIAHDGIGAELAVNYLDLSDPAVMREVKALTGQLAGRAEGLQAAFLENPVWDDLSYDLWRALSMNVAVYWEFRDKTCFTAYGSFTGYRDAMETSVGMPWPAGTRPFPSAIGVLFALKTLAQAQPVESKLPRLTAWAKACPIACKQSNCATLPPKFKSASGGGTVPGGGGGTVPGGGGGTVPGGGGGGGAQPASRAALYVAGGAGVLLLIAAMTRGGKKKRRSS